MSDVLEVSRSLRDHFKDLSRDKVIRILTVPGVEYVGKVLTVGSDHVVLETEFHVATIALAHIVSARNEPTGRL